MDNTNQGLDALKDIKRIMERSSRFISLSGWSGVSAGICALAGAGAAYYRLLGYRSGPRGAGRNPDELVNDFIWIGAITFAAAFLSSFFFTWLRSRKNGTPMWDRTVQRLAWNTVLPMAAGGFVILRSIELGYLVLVAPACLIFYGLALVN